MLKINNATASVAQTLGLQTVYYARNSTLLQNLGEYFYPPPLFQMKHEYKKNFEIYYTTQL